MADQTLPPRPELITADDGTLTHTEGWYRVLVAADRQTVVAAWDEDGTFWQWETTEVIVTQLMEALVDLQALLPTLRDGAAT